MYERRSAHRGEGLSAGCESSASQVRGPASPRGGFGVSRLGRREVIKLVLGPSLIALAISMGGEWLLAPLTLGTVGFVGVGIVITISALLHVYNIEFSRYALATGEVAVVGFARVPPGAAFWVPFSLLILFVAFIWGGPARRGGLFALLRGRVPAEGHATNATLLALVLLGVVLLITVLTRKVTRSLELRPNLTFIAIQLLSLLVIDVLFVPFSIWWDGLRGLIPPRFPARAPTRPHRWSRGLHCARLWAQLVRYEPLSR